MGKVTGFMEFRRAAPGKAPVEERTKHFKEFEHPFEEEVAKTQGARCMDCGIPFCHGDTGCPVDNLIPEWNDLVYRGRWEEALQNLHSTNNFPEFTGRLCPAPCESACVLGINEPPVAIKAIERTIVDRGFEAGHVQPQPPARLSGRRVAIVGSGPAGLACAQQLQRAGHSVTVFEKNDRLGGLLRYGIPDFKMEKWIIDRRVNQMRIEGVDFRTGVHVGVDVKAGDLLEKYDALVLAGGCEVPRDLGVPGRELKNIRYAMEFLVPQNKVNAGDTVPGHIDVKDAHVVVIGGGDTGSDCVGTCNRQGARSVTQIELFPEPPAERPDSTPWPQYPRILRTSTSHEEGVERRWSVNTLGFRGNDRGEVTHIFGSEVEEKDGRFVPVSGTDFEWPADHVFLAMGFVRPPSEGLLSQLVELGMEIDGRGNVKASFGTTPNSFATTLPSVYACGDMRRGQSLIVWAISEGRKCAAEVHRVLSAVSS